MLNEPTLLFQFIFYLNAFVMLGIGHFEQEGFMNIWLKLIKIKSISEASVYELDI